MGLEKQLSLEKQLRGAYDLAHEILSHIETARDSLAEDNTKRVAWEIGCATGVTFRLNKELLEIAQEQFYEVSDETD